jgi:hypothetical protein
VLHTPRIVALSAKSSCGNRTSCPAAARILYRLAKGSLNEAERETTLEKTQYLRKEATSVSSIGRLKLQRCRFSEAVKQPEKPAHVFEFFTILDKKPKNAPRGILPVKVVIV